MAVDFAAVADGLPAVLEMCRRIREKIDLGKRDYWGLGQKVDGILSRIPEKDEIRELGAILQYVKKAVRYTKDPVNLDTIRDAGITGDPVTSTLERGAGDCDDMAAVLGAAAEYAGYPTRLALCGDLEAGQGHVYPEAWTRARGWVPMDATEKARPLGWRAPLPTYVFEEDQGMIRAMNGTAGVGSWFSDLTTSLIKPATDFGTQYVTDQLADQFGSDSGGYVSPLQPIVFPQPIATPPPPPSSGLKITAGTVAVGAALLGVGYLILKKKKRRRRR